MKKRIRLISLDGKEVVEAEVFFNNRYAIIFSHRVFLFGFTQGTIDHYREVKAERVNTIETLRNTSSPRNIAQGE